MSEEEGDLVPQRESLGGGRPLPEFVKNHSEIFRIGVFEGVGTLMLAYGICIGQYLPPVKDRVPNVYYDFFISAVLFLALCWSGAMTGGHLNPDVTLGQMFRSPNVSLRTGLVYMVTQFLGALLGALLGTPILTQRTGSTTWSPAPTTKPPPSATWPWTSWARPSAPSSSCSSS